MFTIGQLSQWERGRVVGNPEMEISGVQPFETAQVGDITLATAKKYLARLGSTHASAVIVPLGTSCREALFLYLQ